MKFNNEYKIGKNVVIGKNVKIGDGTVIYDNVVIGDDSIIANNCVIGEPLTDYYSNQNYINPKTIIGKNCLIRSHSIIYAGSLFGNFFQTGHRVTIRENTTMGDHCSVGTLSVIEGFAKFGNYCRMQSNSHVCQTATLGNFVFIYPNVVLTNDPTPPSNTCIGPTIGDYTQITTGSLIMPGIKIGENCLVGAGSIVTKDVEDYSLVVGSPAKKVRDVREIESREKKGEKHYPWMYNFSRGMPWEGIGFEKWLSENGGKEVKYNGGYEQKPEGVYDWGWVRNANSK
jgi:acetyltransferase-like isoleucine patch superfamily enzyme